MKSPKHLLACVAVILLLAVSQVVAEETFIGFDKSPMWHYFDGD